MLASLNKWLEFTAQRISNDLFLMFHLHQVQYLTWPWEWRHWVVYTNRLVCYNTSTGVDCTGQLFHGCPLPWLQAAQRDSWEVFTLWAAVWQQHKVTDWVQAALALQAVQQQGQGPRQCGRATHPGHAVPRLSQPKESSWDMSPWADTSFPKHSVCR